MSERVFLEEDNMGLSVSKISMYKKEEDVSFDSLYNIIVSTNSCYNTDNKRMLNTKLDEARRKMQTLSKIHDANIYVLNTKIDQHIELKKKNIAIMTADTNEGIDVRVSK